VQSNGPRIQVTERPSGAAGDGRARAVPRGDAAEVPRMTPERGVRSAPALRSGTHDTGGSSRPSMDADRDPRPRAVPRGDTGDAGRVVPERGIRSAPAIRSGATGDEDNPARSRAMPRAPGSAIERAPSRPDSDAYSPSSRRAPMPPQRPADPGVERAEPQRAPGVRAVPRGGYEGGSTGPSRMPAERRAPEGASGGERASPRAVPQGRPSSPPGMERRAPSQRSGDAPSQRSSDAPSRSAPERSAAPSRRRG